MLGGEVALLGAIRREVIELPAAGEFRHELPRANAHSAVPLVLPKQRTVGHRRAAVHRRAEAHTFERVDLLAGKLRRVFCAGYVHALNENGTTLVFAAGDTYAELGKNTLDEMSLATPAVADPSLFLRTQTKLYRITEPTP